MRSSQLDLPDLTPELLPLNFKRQQFNITDLASSIMDLAQVAHRDSPAEYRAKEKNKSPAAKALNIPYEMDKLIRQDSNQAEFYNLIDLFAKGTVK
jgi:hypothetical protein